MKIIGHGGAKGLASANSAQAIAKALQYKVDVIELDIRVSADGIPVLIHDDVLIDAAGNRLVVADTNAAELIEHAPDVITLEAAIKIVARQVPIYIEIKKHVAPQPVIALLDSLLAQDYTDNDFMVGSYDQSVLRAVHTALPTLPLLVIEDWSSMRAVLRARQLGTKQIAMLEYWLWSGYLGAMSRRGYQIYCFRPFHDKGPLREKLYTKLGLIGHANNPKKALLWARHGLAGVITDYPDLFTD